MLPLALRSSRRLTVAVTAIVFGLVFLSLLTSPVGEKTQSFRQWTTENGDLAGEKTPDNHPWSEPPRRGMHILLPATQSNVNFCKTLLTMTILGYPNPRIVAWGDDDSGGGLVGGGSHYAKITRVLDYDIWFQLPIHTLLDRYEDIIAEENARVAYRMGKAYDREGIYSQIVFGAGKRCAPNQLHTLACYPVPESPIPYDIRGGNTDTILGRTPWSSYRTRYLNSGYMIGPVREVRPLLERAKVKLAECIDRVDAPFDGGSGTSDLCYHGSDQSIFVEMFGEQEFHREVMRRKHRNFMDDYLDKVISGRAGAKPPPTHIQNVPISDYTNPDFPHQLSNDTYLSGKPFEFGIALDYWSTLGHQSANAEFDFRYIRHDKPLEPQVGKTGLWDCPGMGPMPKDLPSGKLELLGNQEPNRWETLPLFTEMCVGTVPVMIHHNSVDKWQREAQWDRTWWHGRARALLDERRRQGSPQLMEGIPVEGGPVLSWDELCPADVESELFRDEPPPPPLAPEPDPEKKPGEPPKELGKI